VALPVGLLKIATVNKFNSKTGVLEVNIDLSNNSLSKNVQTVSIPFSLYSSGGLFIGTIPEPGTTVVVGQGEGEWYFVSFLLKNTAAQPTLKIGEILLQSNANTKITLDKSNSINIGSFLNKIYINTSRNIIIDNFNDKLSFTHASREINGVIRRDKNPNKNIASTSRLDDSDYDKFLKPIGLDPQLPTNSDIKGSSKNPAFVEKRELVYEFVPTSNVDDELFESLLYGKSSSNKPQYDLANRRINRTDTLSLSLVAPNYLIETIKGTVVDLFGNLLDLNRQPLLIGDETLTLKKSGDSDKVKTYLKIRELQRKSLAFHFEINSRKNLLGKNGFQLPDIESNADYSRNRSRFFVDVDKEGQMKVNVPASSETGNIPLLVRYENYSTYGTQDNGNVNKHYFRTDNKDIFADSFANSFKPTTLTTNNRGQASSFTVSTMAGIAIVDETDGNIAPKDRILGEVPIFHNTPYHNILDTCFTSHTSQNNKFINFAYNPSFDVSTIPTIDKIVSDTIKVSGDGANAGGRSGSFNFDGSLEMSVGANTIDRQSLWLDTAGSIIANMGRDKNYTSAAISMDGDLILQVGGTGISSDSRFTSAKGFNNAFRPGAIDIRVFNAGFDCTLVRIDGNGVKISTPGEMAFHSVGTMSFRSEKSMSFDSEHIDMHGRPVLKDPSQGSI